MDTCFHLFLFLYEIFLSLICKPTLFNYWFKISSSSKSVIDWQDSSYIYLSVSKSLSQAVETKFPIRLKILFFLGLRGGVVDNKWIIDYKNNDFCNSYRNPDFAFKKWKHESLINEFTFAFHKSSTYSIFIIYE